MNEFWINTQDDWSDFLSFLRDEKMTLSLNGRDNDGYYLAKAGDLLVHIPDTYNIPGSLVPKQEVIENPIKPKYDPLIFGKEQTENIVNITVDNEQVFIYKSDGSVDIQEYYNWAVGANWDEGCSRLKGNQYYKFIKELPEDQFYALKNNWNPRIWTPRTASEGYMLRSGSTYYKGMKTSDVSLLSFDIEATSLDKNDPEAFVPLVSTTYRDRSGYIEKRVFDYFKYEKEDYMWADLNSYVCSTKADIILGHNILSYDLPYLDKNSTGLNWGRDNSRILFDDKASKIRKDGSQSYEFFNATIHGREIIDTFFLSLKYDISREFPSYGLKAIETHLGLVKEDRTWDFKEWPTKRLVQARRDGNIEIWEKFKKYCSDDSDSPIKIFDLMIPSFFYLAQSVPKTLQQMICEASGSQLDSLMIRSYLQDGYSLPRSSQKAEFEGAISMGVPGIYKSIKKIDVASLYPSIMLEYNIYDNKKDPERNMLKMLEYFRNERLTNKKLAKDTGDKYYEDLQSSQKILINSLYGYMGAGYLLFNYPEGAAEVTKHGREILLKAVEWATGHTLEKVIKSTSNKGLDNEEDKFHWVVGSKVSEGLGYTLINVDTDSISYSNGNQTTKEEFHKEIESLNSIYPKLIKWEDDGIYEKLIVVKAKNYVLVKDGKIKYKGSSFKSSQKEPGLSDMLMSLINEMLNGNKIEYLTSIYKNFSKEALNPIDIKRWCVKKTITKAVLNSERSNEQKVLNACHDAIQQGVIQGIQEGDKVHIYSAINGQIQKVEKGQLVFLKNSQPKMIDNCILKFAELYNNDHDKWHYVERVYDTLCILEKVLDITKFTKYHLNKNRKLLEEI